MKINTPPPQQCVTTIEPIGMYERDRNNQIAENERFLKKLLSSPSTKSTIDNTSKSMNVQSNVANTHCPPRRIKSINNCGVHTFIRILTLQNNELQRKMSTNFIEEHSMSIRAWMIQIILETGFSTSTWQESLQEFIANNQTLKWFNKAAKLSSARATNRAIMTLMPHEYISGDAIHLSFKALKYQPPKRTYMYDVLSSRLSEPSLWRSLWKPPRDTFEQRIKKIVLPINVHDTHWYIAIVKVTRTECTIDIQNNLTM